MFIHSTDLVIVLWFTFPVGSDIVYGHHQGTAAVLEAHRFWFVQHHASADTAFLVF